MKDDYQFDYELAIRVGKPAGIQRLIKAGKQPHKLAVLYSVANERSFLIPLLVAGGANPDACDAYGTRALGYAVRSKSIEDVRILLESGADPDAISTLTRPLADAARHGKLECVKLLLLYKANPNLAEQTGITALQDAARYEYPEICKLLLDAGADPNAKGPDKESARSLAAKSGDPRLWSMFGHGPPRSVRRRPIAPPTEIVHKVYQMDIDKLASGEPNPVKLVSERVIKPIKRMKGGSV